MTHHFCNWGDFSFFSISTTSLYSPFLQLERLLLLLHSVTRCCDSICAAGFGNLILQPNAAIGFHRILQPKLLHATTTRMLIRKNCKQKEENQEWIEAVDFPSLQPTENGSEQALKFQRDDYQRIETGEVRLIHSHHRFKHTYKRKNSLSDRGRRKKKQDRERGGRSKANQWSFEVNILDELRAQFEIGACHQPHIHHEYEAHICNTPPPRTDEHRLHFEPVSLLLSLS